MPAGNQRDGGVTPNIRFRSVDAGQNWLFQNNSSSGVFAIRYETAGNSPVRAFPGGAESTLTVRNDRVGVGNLIVLENGFSVASGGLIAAEIAGTP